MPGKIRVSALAKELGITSKQALAALNEIGEPGKTASSTVDQDIADRVRQQVADPAIEPAAAPVTEAPAAPVTEAITEPVLEPVAEAAAPAKRAPRKRAAKKAAEPAADPAAEATPTLVEGAAADAAADPAAVPPVDSTEKAAPARKTRKRAAKKAPAGAATDAAGGEGPAMAAPGVLFIAPTAEEAAAAEAAASGSDDAAGDDDTETADLREAAIEQANGARRRRRRGRRGRGGGGNAETNPDSDDSTDDDADATGSAGESDDTADDSSDDATDGSGGDETSSSSRRRRRRRRSDSGGAGAAAGSDDEGDDPPNTVVHVRETKKKGGRGGGGSGNAAKDDDGDDGVRGVKGSTRLEAKRQRRRDGRDTSRRRAPILTEAEFLARREAVDRVMAVRQQGDRTQIAVLEDDVLVEHYVTRASATSYVGNVYLGRVQNVLPSMEAAFIDIGKGRNGVLYAGEVNWDAAGLEGKSRAIEQALKSGDPVLVQVTKDPIGHKGARLTSQVSLPGRFLVYVPGGGMTGISRRLPDTERHRLKAILKKIVPEDAGVIVRTAAEGASEEDLTRDVERLQAQWEQIQQKSEQKKSAPVLVHGEPDLAVRVVRDVFNEDFQSLVVEGDEAWTTVSEYLGGVAPDLAERASRHAKDTDLFHDLRIDEQLMKALDRKVWLPSGGSLVIDRTEAMTVVDVNTGKFVGSGGNLEQTVTRNNLEAAEEVVRQLRLRDVGGIIVIDFIDMVLESNRELVLRRLTECLGRDRTKHQVAEVTSLGLVQMTRKRVGEGLLEAFSEPCDHCRGRGVLIQGEPVDQPASGSGGGGSGNGGSGGSGGNSASPAAEDDRPKGKRRRGRSSQGAPAAEPELSPSASEEQRRAAAAAIAAIHRAAEAGDDEDTSESTADGGSAEVDELASGLVAAARRVDAQPAAEPEPAPAAEPEPAHLADEAPSIPAESQAEPAGSANGTANGSAATTQPPARRRRRAASRPAGPPVGTP